MSETLDKAQVRFDNEFSEKGKFRFARGQSLQACIRAADVPNTPGAYLIYGVKARRMNLLYIGKAGTVNTDGSLKAQGLAKRLTMKQDGMRRQKYFESQMRKLKLDYLEFRWWVTMDVGSRVLPVFAEAQLMQAYYKSHGRLPAWNKAA